MQFADKCLKLFRKLKLFKALCQKDTLLEGKNILLKQSFHCKRFLQRWRCNSRIGVHVNVTSSYIHNYVIHSLQLVKE
jgi:hypothetical protein